MRGLLSLVAGLGLTLVSGTASIAATEVPVTVGITYDVSRTLSCVECRAGGTFFGADSGETISVTGTITLPATRSYASSSAITAFDLLLGNSIDPALTQSISSSAGGQVTLSGGALLTATASELIFSGPTGSSIVFSDIANGVPFYEMTAGSITEFSLASPTATSFFQGGASVQTASTAVLGRVSAVPLPAGLPMALAGLAALGILTRRPRGV